jgi:hypothetical protein
MEDYRANRQFGKSWLVAGWMALPLADAEYEAELRGAMARMIPSLIKPLEDEEANTRWAAVRLIGSLGNHGESRLSGITAQLIRIISRVSCSNSECDSTAHQTA